MKKHFWTEADVALLRQHYPTTETPVLAQALGRPPRQVLAKANAMGVHKTREFIAAIARERSLRPGHGAQACQFKPGFTPWNKGVKGVVGVQEACRATQFKPGSRPHTWVPVGSYRISADGCLEQKVNDLPGNSNVRWKAVHRLVWEAANGPMPRGSIVVFKLGCRTLDAALITLDVVECLTRRENVLRNSVHTLPKALAELVQLRGALNRQINKRLKRAEEATT